MFCVAYKENGMLKKAEILKLNDMTAEFTIPKDLEACDIETYVWDQDMRPLMEKHRGI